MTEYHKYSIKKNRFKRSLLIGLEPEGENELKCPETVFERFFVCDRIDGMEQGARWGRLHLDWQLEEEMVVIIHTTATDQTIISFEGRQLKIQEELLDPEKNMAWKLRLMEQLGAKRKVHHKDQLLLEHSGRYFYLIIEVRGTGQGTLKNLFITNQGESILGYLKDFPPEYGSFYHRYMSIFSSLHMDFQDEILSVSDNFDIEQAPKELLLVFAQWMGMEIPEDFLPEEKIRALVKEAYLLNRIRGSAKALLKICEIVLDEQVVLLEKNVLKNETQAESTEVYEKLYGSGEFDVTILYHSNISGDKKNKLMYLLNQYKPVRCRIRLIASKKSGEFDGHIYLDCNAQISDSQPMLTEEKIFLDENMIIF